MNTVGSKKYRVLDQRGVNEKDLTLDKTGQLSIIARIMTLAGHPRSVIYDRRVRTVEKACCWDG